MADRKTFERAFSDLGAASAKLRDLICRAIKSPGRIREGALSPLAAPEGSPPKTKLVPLSGTDIRGQIGTVCLTKAGQDPAVLVTGQQPGTKPVRYIWIDRRWVEG